MKYLLKIMTRAFLALAFIAPIVVLSQDAEPEPAVEAETEALPETAVVATQPVPEPAPAPPAPAPAPTPAPPAPAPAPASEPEPVVVEPMVDPLLANDITAFRTGTPLLDIPQSVSIFTDQRIDDQGFTSLGEIVDYTPGLSITQGEGHRDAVVFRGQRSTADFYIDGLRDDVQYYRPLYNVERVEILRGPAALYFGRGGTGGLINRVMKKPILAGPGDAKQPHESADFFHLQNTVDTFGGNIHEFDWNQQVSANSGFRINGMYEYLNNHRDFYDGDRWAINPTYAIELGPDTRFDVSYEYSQFERFIDRGIPTGDNGRPVEFLRGVVFGDSELNYANFEAHQVRVTLDHKFNVIWEGRVTAYHGDFDKRYENYYASGYDQATDQVTIDGYVDTTQRQNSVIAADLIGNFSTLGLDHTLLIGGEHRHTSHINDRFTDSNTNGRVFTGSTFALTNGSGIGINGPTSVVFDQFNDLDNAEISTQSFFIQDEIGVGSYLDVVLGARYDNIDVNVQRFDANGNLRAGTGFKKDDVISPRLGLVLKPTDRLSVYGAYSKTFLPRSGDQFANLGSNGDRLSPDEYSNLEAGINWNIIDDLGLRMAIFELENSSPEVDANDPSQLVVVDSETTGFEFELSGFVTDDWYVAAGYTYLDGEVADQQGGTGIRPRELPENMFSLWNRYQLTDCFGLGLGVVYQDESFMTTPNPARGFAGIRPTLPAYTRVDAAAYYRLSDRTRIQLNVENLFDELYFPSSHSTHQATVGRPINAAISVKTSF